jgi:hypothetical protein
LLEELDAAYPHTRRGCIHSSQDIRFDAGHELPLLRIARVGDTGTCNIRTCSHNCSHGHLARGPQDAHCMFDMGLLSDAWDVTYMCL